MDWPSFTNTQAFCYRVFARDRTDLNYNSATLIAKLVVSYAQTLKSHFSRVGAWVRELLGNIRNSTYIDCTLDLLISVLAAGAIEPAA